MSKPLPRYSICTLSGASHQGNDFIADHLGKYIGEHSNLKFPHKHSFYHLVFFKKGGGNHSIDFVRFPVKAGQLYFMIPEQVHTWEFKENVDGYIVNFNDRFIYSLVNNPRYLDQFSFLSGDATQQVIDVPIKIQPEMKSLFERIIAEQESDGLLKNDLVRISLLQLLIITNRCCARTQGKTRPNNSVLLSHFKKLIDLHYKEKTNKRICRTVVCNAESFERFGERCNGPLCRRINKRQDIARSETVTGECRCKHW
jgi:hypothetical protein